MRYIEWLFLLAVGAAGTGLANLVGYGVGFGESLPGLAVMVGIVMLGVVCMKVLPLWLTAPLSDLLPPARFLRFVLL